MIDLNYQDKLRLSLFKKQIEEQTLPLKGLSDEDLLKILNAAVIPNAMSITAVRYSVLFNLIFTDEKTKRDRTITAINKSVNFVENLTKTEKIILKYAVVKGFETTFWKKEFFKFLKTPLSLKKQTTGRKILSGRKFKEIFFFARNLAEKGKKNERPPRF